jgi:hypothetical protein
MKTMLICTSLTLTLLATAGCASMRDEPTMAMAAPAPAQTQRISSDFAYMARVERAAVRRGVALQWVNPPFKHDEPTH